MIYNLHIFFRNIIMRLIRKNCDSCRHYDGRFGDDTCFTCERSIKAVEYERK